MTIESETINSQELDKKTKLLYETLDTILRCFKSNEQLEVMDALIERLKNRKILLEQAISEAIK